MYMHSVSVVPTSCSPRTPFKTIAVQLKQPPVSPTKYQPEVQEDQAMPVCTRHSSLVGGNRCLHKPPGFPLQNPFPLWDEPQGTVDLGGLDLQ